MSCGGCGKQKGGRPIKVQIQRATETVGATYGERTDTWATVATVRGTLKWRTGGEDVKALQVDGRRVGTFVFRKRAYSALVPKDRFLIGTRVLQIHTCYDRDESGQEWTCLVTEDTDPEE